MENNKAIQSILDKVATACTCDEKIYRAYRHTFQTIYSHMQSHATTILKFQERCAVNLLDAMVWGESAVVSQCKFEIYASMFGRIESAILQGENPCFALSKLKQVRIETLRQYNGTSTSVFSNAVDYCHRVAIQDIFIGFHSDYDQISEIVQRESQQA